MKPKLLGRDGLSSDEMVSEYYASGPYVTRVKWGKRSVIMPDQAIIFLASSLVALPYPESAPSENTALRENEIKGTIETICAHYGLKEEAKP